MNILMLAPSMSKKSGGVTTSVLNFYNGLKRLEVQCTVIFLCSESEQADIDNNILNNNDFILFDMSYEFWRYAKSLKDYLKNNISNYDIVWIHGLWTSIGYYGAKFAKINEIPYVVTPHGMIEPNALQIKGFKKQIYWQFIEKEIFNHAHSVHCITKQESQYSKQLAQTNTFIVPNGVSAKALTNKNNINNVFCFIGRIHEIKGLDLLLRAIADIKNIKLIIAGSGIKQYEDYILNLIKTLKIENRIEWLGFANENIKYKIFLSSCCTIVPSHSEVLSIVGIESIANSTPVLITRQCNFNEIEEFNAGMIMPDNNPDTIKKYLLKMLDSDIDVMSKNAYNLAMEKYDIDIVSKKILDKFKQIITLKKR